MALAQQWAWLGRAVVWLLYTTSAVAAATGVVKVDDSGHYDLINLLLAALAALAAALAFVFRQWLIREQEWRKTFMSIIHDFANFNATANKAVHELEKLNHNIRSIYGKTEGKDL
jgi:hypothetical protein